MYGSQVDPTFVSGRISGALDSIFILRGYEWKKSFKNPRLDKKKKETRTQTQLQIRMYTVGGLGQNYLFMWRLVTIIQMLLFFMVYCGFILYSGHSINVLINSLCYNLCTTNDAFKVYNSMNSEFYILPIKIENIFITLKRPFNLHFILSWASHVPVISLSALEMLAHLIFITRVRCRHCL